MADFRTAIRDKIRSEGKTHFGMRVWLIDEFGARGLSIRFKQLSYSTRRTMDPFCVVNFTSSTRNEYRAKGEHMYFHAYYYSSHLDMWDDLYEASEDVINGLHQKSVETDDHGHVLCHWFSRGPEYREDALDDAIALVDRFRMTLRRR